MTLMDAFRHNSSPLGRAVVVLFAASWLGLAVQPCAASGTHGAGMPEPEMPAGHGHDCPHCPPPADESHECATMAVLGCAAAGEPAVTSAGVKAPDTCQAVAIVHASMHAGLARPGPVLAQAPPDPGRSVASRTVQQRYCTYLK